MRPRILLAVTDPFSSVLIQGQAASLAGAGAEVGIVTSPGEWAQGLAEREDADYHPVVMRREIAPLSDLRACFALVRLLRRVRPDLVIAGTPKAALLTLAAAAIVRVPARVFWLLGLRSATLHGVKRLLVLAAERASGRLATDVLSVSASLRDEAVAAGIVDRGRTHTVGAGSCTGIDLERFCLGSEERRAAEEFRRDIGVGQDDTLIGFVGRMTRDKGLPELAEAWALVRGDRTRLVVIGPDEHEPECGPALCRLQADPCVRFTGTMADMLPAYAALDVLVLPTLREGFGVVLIEAAAMATPVVASRVTGCVDVVVHGETGTLVPPRDPVALARALRDYVGDPRLRAEHGAAGRRRVERLFDGRVVRRGHCELYDAILRRQGRPGLDLSPIEVPTSSSAPPPALR